uniref:IS3 family transposase n=1 Tax=Paenibacillus sp. FSL R5-0766 TaxID=2921658 RepID=UPI0009FAA3CD
MVEEMAYLREEVEQQVREYILFYNQNRFQKRLNGRSPADYRETPVRKKATESFVFGCL